MYQNVDEYELIDHALNFQLITVYINPEKQISELIDLRFKNIKIYSLFDGMAISSLQQLNDLTDPWLYYLAER